MDGSPRTPALGLAALLCLSAPAAADLVVDPSGAGDHTTIQAAVDAAAPDELILVKAGTYAGSVVVDGKALWIAAFDGAQVTIVGTLEVLNLAAGEAFVAIGIDALPPDSTNQDVATPPGLRLFGNQGEVRIHDGTFVGAQGLCDQEEPDGCSTAGGDGGDGVLIQGSARVAFATSTFVGGVGGEPGFAGEGAGASGHGAREETSAVGAWACEFIGGQGRSHYGWGGRGGDGFHSESFGVFGASCRFEGGDGGNNHDFISPIGGNGGDGLFVKAGSQARTTADCTMIPGAAGVPTCGTCGGVPGLPGQATRGAGAFVNIAGKGRTIEGPAVIADGAPTAWVIRGMAGDVQYFRAAGRPDYRWVPWRRGFDLADVLYMDHAPMGVLPPGGELSTSYPTYRLGGTGGFQSRRLFGQSFVHAGDGGIVLGAPHDVVLVNCSGGPDCDVDGISDACEIDFGAPDCDGNGIPDACDAVTDDCNENGLPDVCELTGNDCNGNSIPDECDLAGGASLDVNGNGVPDECDERTWYVDAGAARGGDGTAGAPFQALEQAYAAALGGDMIVLADGVYDGPANRDVDNAGRDLTVRGANGAAGCVIDCQGAGRAFSVSGGTLLLEGLTIRNGSEAIGGGVMATPGSALTVSGCRFEDCVGTQVFTGGGGAIHSAHGVLTVTASSFLRCTATGSPGGGIFVQQSVARIDGCAFVECVGLDGGAVFANSIGIQRSTFLGNTATRHGGAVIVRGNARVEGCLVVGNSASAHGGGIHQGSFASLDVLNTTLVDNAAGSSGLGGGVFSIGSLYVSGCVLRGNTAFLGDQFGLSNTTTIAFSDVEGGLAAIWFNGPPPNYGAGNVDLDPLFVDADGADDDPLTLADNDYRLGVGSPCIDAADNGDVGPDALDLDGDLDVLEPLPFDLDGNPRFADDPAVVDTGVGTPPIVDMGAYERQP